MKKLLLSLLSVILVISMCVSCSTGVANTVKTTVETSTETTPSGVVSTDSYLNGTKLDDYVIIYNSADHDYSLRAAKYIQNEIFARTEVGIEIIEDNSQSTSDYEIIVGDTNRELSKSFSAPSRTTEFALNANETQIAMKGEYFVIAAAAYFFIETCVPQDNFDANVPKELCIHKPIVEEAKNYIMLIGDGMGPNQTLLFDDIDNNLSYSDKEDVFYGYYLPYQGWSRTDSISGTTDSAAGGTALSCGLKTKNRYVGQNQNHQAVTSITELAASLGKSTAVMSTEGSTGATPASFSAHANDRDDTTTITNSQKELTKKYGTIINCSFDVYSDEIETRINNTLRKLETNEKGFFMMYEEAHIDKHCHNQNISKTFNAVVRFNKAIATFMEYAFYNPDTFVLITADHETGSLLPNSNGKYSFNSGSHSSANVPVFAYGYNAELFNNKTIENVQIPQTIASFMGNKTFGDQTRYKYLSK